MLTQSDTTTGARPQTRIRKVDAEGQQLPYVDRIVTDIVDSETYHLKIIAGETDVAFVNTAFENFSLYKQNEDAGGYNVVLLPGNKGADVGVRVNQNHPDPVKGGIYRDVRFRQAISLAIDRDDLNNALFFGLAVPRQFTILPSATYYKPEWGEAYADFDPDRANELLDAVGLSARDNQGFRVGADGKTFELAVEYGVGGEAGDPTASLELVKEYWENVGIKVLLKSWESGYFWERMQDPEHEIAFHAEQSKEVRSFMVERESWTAARGWAPLWQAWLIADANIKDGSSTLADFGGELPGEEPPDYVKQLFQWGEDRIQTQLGSPEYHDLSQKIYDWHAEHLVHIGAVGQAPLVYIANKKLGNVPKEFYTGIGGSIDLNITADQLFFQGGYPQGGAQPGRPAYSHAGYLELGIGGGVQRQFRDVHVGRLGDGEQDQVRHVLRLPKPRRVVAMVVAAHLRVHRPRFHQGGLDAVPAPLLPGDAGEPAHAELGRAVCAVVGARMAAGKRRHVEDVAAPALTHVAEHRLRAQKHRLQVYRHVAVPQLLGDFRYRRGARHPGVVDQDVHRTETVNGLRHIACPPP